MGHQLVASPSSPRSQAPLLSSSWDGKCHCCRKLMSRCSCYHETESDVEAMDRRGREAAHVLIDATEPRPLWNALRKMHRRSTVTHRHKSLSSVLLSASSGGTSKEKDHRTSRAALPPLSVPPPAPATSSCWSQHVHRRSEARSRPSTRRHKTELSRDRSRDCSTRSHKEKLQHGSIPTCATSTSTSSRYQVTRETSKEVGVSCSMRSTNGTDMDLTSSVCYPKEKFYDGPEDEIEPSSGSVDGTVWEL
ncbi:unnamed protein product [Hyaloperonospora brassicae]|uniref:RxLR effector candidate protein n=1 Tax=Hyaloperonospora brassicae TaxID=162125 RepID=A0AAV0TL95_HYABA|nr:unnamed protein product [Hyaloperonospora brassicae]